MSKPPIHVVVVLVQARGARGQCGHSKGSWDAWRLGLVENMGTHYELNLRGMDIADEAIALAKTAKVRDR